jgi:hypothetical protein
VDSCAPLRLSSRSISARRWRASRRIYDQRIVGYCHQAPRPEGRHSEPSLHPRRQHYHPACGRQSCFPGARRRTVQNKPDGVTVPALSLLDCSSCRRYRNGSAKNIPSTGTALGAAANLMCAFALSLRTGAWPCGQPAITVMPATSALAVLIGAAGSDCLLARVGNRFRALRYTP